MYYRSGSFIIYVYSSCTTQSEIWSSFLKCRDYAVPDVSTVLLCTEMLSDTEQRVWRPKRVHRSKWSIHSLTSYQNIRNSSSSFSDLMTNACIFKNSYVLVGNNAVVADVVEGLELHVQGASW